MDNRSLQELFSRASTPPQHQTQSNSPAAVSVAQHPPNNSSSDLIDSLFQSIMIPQDHQSQQSGSQDASHIAPDTNIVPSASISPPLPLTDEPPVSSSSATSVATTVQERQSALLSLLNQPNPNTNRPAPVATISQSQPQQVPTPPGSSRSNASPSQVEHQKILLEQLMGSAGPRSNAGADSQRSSHSAPSAPSPPYNPTPRDAEFRSYNQHDHVETSPRVQPISSGHPIAQSQPTPPAIQHQSQQFSPQPVAHQVPLPSSQPQSLAQPALNPPSPRRSMFEFMSPFDHLSSTTASIKKKPVPTQSASASSTNDDSSWTHVTDPKRQSVENLLDTLTRGQPSMPAQHVQAQNNPYDSYINDHNSYPIQTELYQSRAPPPPLPPKPPVQRNPSPRSSPPKPRAPQQQAVQSVTGLNRRDKEGSPGPRNGARNKNLQQTKAASKTLSSPSPQAQSIIFDVSKMLDDVQAPRDSVKSTAIALVRQESVFLPGTTIGATHWVAYAMTRGRVRVISRSSGDRTLLQLPHLFPSSTSVIDMAVFGNRLAGVTSDGGFVLWELPDVITDDVPGNMLLCIPPTNDPVDTLRAVKWHPKEPDTLAIASDTKIYVIHLNDITNLQGPVPHGDLHHIGQLYGVQSMICAFDFDPLHYSLAAITEDSTLTLWNLQDTIPYATHKVRGEDIPSFLSFVDGGIVVGRKNGTIFQLLAHSTKTVLSTIKFINSQQEDPDMFGHANYDSRIQTLWIANSRRESIIACKLNIESSYVNGEEQVRGHFEQLVEFTGPKATIHFVILTGDSDPHGDEAHAACVAAKLPPGELALVAFSVHSSGVDQVLIRKEWFDTALMSAHARFPAIDLPPPVVQQRVPSPTESSITASKPPRTLPIPPTGPPTQMPITGGNHPSAPTSGIFPPARGRTPPPDEGENEFSRAEEGRHGDAKSKGIKAKSVNWKEKEDVKDNSSTIGGGKDKSAKVDTTSASEPALTQVLSKEMKKTEDSLHNRLSRLISKEMDKQHQRLEDARVHEQAEDFARQEKILKLISNELTRNTTRVVEMAVKNEVQNSVLPSLENITKNEVKAALNEQVGRGLVDVINQNLPVEIEKLFTRPDISSHFAHVISSNLTPLIERQIKDAVVKTFIPVFSQQASTLHQELLREVRGELNGLKSELNAWKNDALIGQENSIRDLEHTVRQLADQVKFLTMNMNAAPPAPIHHLQQAPQPSQGSPAGSMHNIHRQAPPPNNNQPSSSYSHPHQPYQHVPPPLPPAPQPQQATGPVHQPWFAIAAPQASHPATIPQPPPQPQAERTPPIKADQWDEIYLGILHTQDPHKLRDLLSHTNPDLIMPLNGPSLVSQAVILTLVHRLSSIVGETSPNDESFKSSLWWLQRSVAVLRPEDKLITDFIPRVLPNVQHLLITTKQRLSILPGGGPSLADTARTLTDISETLRRKVAPV